MKRWIQILADTGGLAKIESDLRRCVPPAETPAGLHENIMSAVANSRQTQPVFTLDRRSSESTVSLGTGFARMGRLGWALAPVLALVLAVAWWTIRNRAEISGAQRQDSQAMASLALSSQLSTLNSQLADLQSTPETMVGPLTAEFERLSEDLNRSAQYLLANVP